MQGSSGNLYHGVLRAGGILQVDEHGLEVPSLPEAPEQLAHQTGFSHPPLCSNQRMDTVLDPLHERLDLDLAVEEAVSGDPVSSRFS